MSLNGQWVLLTGAGGGIGSAIAGVLAGQQARLLLSGRNETALEALRERLGLPVEHCRVLSGDLRDRAYRQSLTAICGDLDAGLRVLINNAGVNHFGLLQQLEAAQIEEILTTNLTIPIELIRSLLPLLLQQPRAHIVNIGSTLGSIGFPGFSVYSASKFGLRGVSEALRRELADSAVKVSYLAPRTTRTAFNNRYVDSMNRALGNRSDSPEMVAAAVLRCIDRNGVKDAYLGWPEKLLVRLNGLLPQLIDSALKKQLTTIKSYSLQALDRS
jgi:short-subunit dehydrogenase